MQHPQIQTRDLSDETIKALMEVLVTRYYAERDAQDDIGKKQAEAARTQADRLQRFLDR